MNNYFKKLKKWENELNICIRCGYCYEQCHLFKVFNWETDSPRGKLLLIYGLLTGELKPSSYIAEKIFECFYCKNCEENCSAKVPVTDIFTDAKYELIEKGFDVEGTTSRIDNRKCIRCLTCIFECKSEAISFDIENRKIIVDKIKCKSCGVCVGVCPTDAISQREGFGISKEELFTKVINFIKKDNNGKPKIVIFCCNWSIYPGLQLSQINLSQEDTIFEIIVTMCAGRVDERLILDAFYNGAWGVMIASCPLEECDHNGNYQVERKVLRLKNLFDQIGIEKERLKVEHISTGEVKTLNEAVDKFRNQIISLGAIYKAEHFE